MERKEIKIRSNKIYILTKSKELPVKEIESVKGWKGYSTGKNLLKIEDSRASMKEKLDVFFRKKIGYTPFYDVTLWNKDLKIRKGGDAELGEKVGKIFNNYSKGWFSFTIKNEDLYDLKGG